jgi:hypothetical protein
VKINELLVNDVELKFTTISIDGSTVLDYYKRRLQLNEDRIHMLYMPTRFKTSIRYLLDEGSLDIQQFIDHLSRMDFKKSIKVGDMFCLLEFELLFGFKEILVTGFLSPKVVSKIVMSGPDKINYIEFEDGDRYPRQKPAVVGGKPVSYALYFDNTASAKQALMLAKLSVPPEWSLEIDSSLSSLVVETTQTITEHNRFGGPVVAIEESLYYRFYSAIKNKKVNI